MAKVLIIEDDSIYRETICDVLSTQGYEIFQAANGALGLEIYEQQQPDVIITDIIMPEKGGIEVIRELREMKSKVGIVAISGGGHLNREDVLTAASFFNPDYILEKPFELKDLLKAVELAIKE